MTIGASLRKMYQILEPFRKVTAIIASLLLVGQLLNLAVIFALGKIVHAYSAKDVMSADLWAGAMLLFFGSKNYLNLRREHFEIKRFEHAIPIYLSNLTMTRIFDWSVAQHRRSHTGVLQSIIVEGEQAFMALTHLIAYEIFETVSQMIVTITLIFWMSRFMGFVTFGVAAAFIGTTYAINMHIRESALEYERRKHIVAKSYIEVQRNAPLILVQAQEDRERIFCTDTHTKLRAFGQRMWQWYCTAAAHRNMELGVGEAAIAIAGAHLIVHHRIEAASMVTLLFWGRDLFGRIGGLGPVIRTSYKSWPSIVSYLKLIEVAPELKRDPHPIRPAVICGKVEARHVTFWHGKEDESDPNLVDMNFVIQPGEKIGIVGHSGAGKSTLIGLLLRTTDPNEGAVMIDDVDLRRYDVHQYRNAVGFVEQQVPILDRTLRQNILVGVDPSKITEEWLNEVVRLARIDEFFDTLKDGFDTMLGENGVRLSGGQCQRVGIARALIKNPSILVFDEATSNLDSDNEALVHEAIRKVSKGKTTIIIAHRLSTVRDCDRIFVLQDGKLMAKGDHEELMVASPAYSKLVQRQLM